MSKKEDQFVQKEKLIFLCFLDLPFDQNLYFNYLHLSSLLFFFSRVTSSKTSLTCVFLVPVSKYYYDNNGCFMHGSVEIYSISSEIVFVKNRGKLNLIQKVCMYFVVIH